MLLCHTWPRGMHLHPRLIYHRQALSNRPSAGMAFEDRAFLDECLSRLPGHPNITKTSPEFLKAKRYAMSVFQECRKQRTQMVVERGNIRQYLYHLHDGPEQEERDRKMQMIPTPENRSSSLERSRIRTEIAWI